MNGPSARARFHRTVTEVVSGSPSETRALGICLATELPIPGVVLLSGALGSGKTTLTRGIAEGLGLKDASVVCSPSFTLVNIYQGRCPIYHVDLYRIQGERDLRSVGIDEFLDKDGVTIVEWSDRLSFSVPDAYRVLLEDAGGQNRRIQICRPAPAQSKFKKVGPKPDGDPRGSARRKARPHLQKGLS